MFQTRKRIDKDTNPYYSGVMEIKEHLTYLNECGITDGEIAAAINAPKATVNRLRNGVHKSTSYERGIAIVALANKMRIQDAIDKVPHDS